MPLDSRWIDNDVSHLEGEDRKIARLAIVLAKAPYQVSESLVEPLLHRGEEWFVRFLSWASFTGARRFVTTVADRVAEQVIEGSRMPASVAVA